MDNEQGAASEVMIDGHPVTEHLPAAAHSWINNDSCPHEGGLANCYATLTVLATALAIVVGNASGPGKEDMIQ